MKKLFQQQVLVARSNKKSVRITFYEVIKSTTRTCEIRELRKEILNQTQIEQEVIPIEGEYVGKPIRKKVEPTGCVCIEEGLYAWPWDGKSQWQTAIIFIP